MKIGIDVRAIGRKRTGDETYTLQLVRNLAKIDKDNSYFLYTDTADVGELEGMKARIGIQNENFSLVPVLPSSKALWTFWSLSRQAKGDELDILHVQYISPLFLDRKIKLVTTIHDLSFERYPQFISAKDRIFLKLLIPPSIKRADKIVAVSNFTKREIVELYDQNTGKIAVVYNGGADEVFFRQAGESEKAKLRKLLGFKRPYILYLGTLQPRKNVPALLRSFAELVGEENGKDNALEHNLVIVGSKKGTNYDKRIDKTIDKLIAKNKGIGKRIHFPGYVDDALLPALFQQADIFCFPSLYEGFGLPLIEAMAGGTPVVSSDSSCLKEIGQDAVFFFDYNQERDISGAILKVLGDGLLQNSLRSKGSRIAKKFSWERCAQETLDLYQKLAHNN